MNQKPKWIKVPKRVISIGERLAKKRLEALQKAKDKKQHRTARRQAKEALISTDDNL